MTKKATHQGSCQICGRQQMLPGGKLAKHGYTKEWGFFSGTCPGSDHLPFEQSFDLIEKYRDSSVVQAKAWREDEAGYRAGKGKLYTQRYYRWNDENAPRHLGRKGGYVLEEVTVAAESVDWSDTYKRAVVTFVSDGKADDASRGSYEDTLASLLNANAKRAAENAENHEKYAAWQTARITNWKPGKLIPVKSEAEQQAESVQVGSTVHLFGKDGIDVVVQAIEYKVAHGVGPYLNGNSMPHIGYDYNGKRHWYPVRLIRKTAIIK